MRNHLNSHQQNTQLVATCGKIQCLRVPYRLSIYILLPSITILDIPLSLSHQPQVTMKLSIPCLVAASAQYAFAVAIPEPEVFTIQQPGDFTTKDK
jgi:hypothetical protein